MKRMTKKERLEQARRYESAWHYLFYQLSDFQQQAIIEEPFSKTDLVDDYSLRQGKKNDVAKELARAVAKLAEGDKKIPAVRKKVKKTS